MASSPSSSISEPAIVEQVITEFFAKSAHIILESRSPYVSSRNYSADPFISSPSSSSSSSSFRPRDKWFNLALKDCPAALENFDLWRQSNLEPLVVDVTLNRRKPVRDRVCPSPCSFLVRNLSSDRDEFVRDIKSEKIVERWIVQYDSQGNSWPVREVQASKKGSRVASHATEFQFMYKKAYGRIIVLLRSLYAAVRLLPAYKLFRDLNASGQIHPLSLSHKISSYVEPFSQDEDAEMSQLGFGPLDTFFGKLSVSVNYVKTLLDVSSEPSTPLSTQVINDYVGSPLTDPLKRFESLPSAGETPFSPTLSPTYSDSRALDCNVISHIPSCCLLPDNPISPSSIPLQFSRPSSPSPPSHLYKDLLRSDSSPVSIPLQGESSGRLSQDLPPSLYSKSKRQGYPSQVGAHETQAYKDSVPQASSMENKVQVKKELFGFTEFQSNIMLPKSNTRPSTGLKNPLANVPSIISRTSSRLSSMSDPDDSDLVCPFAEDAESRNSCRVESASGKDCASENVGPADLVPIRSPDAAVGALVWILRNAEPLRLDDSNTSRSMQVLRGAVSSQKAMQDTVETKEEEDEGEVGSTSLGITVSELSKSRTAADALMELRTYKEMRESILKRDGSRMLDIEHIPDSSSGDPSEI